MKSRRQLLTIIGASVSLLTVSGCIEDIGTADPTESNETDGDNSNETDETENIAVNAGVTIEQTSDTEIRVTYTSGGNADHLLIRGDCAFSNDRLEEPGDTTTETCSAGDTISVVAVHKSGAETEINTHTVT